MMWRVLWIHWITHTVLIRLERDNFGFGFCCFFLLSMKRPLSIWIEWIWLNIYYINETLNPMKMSTIDWIIANKLKKQLKCREKQKQHFQMFRLVWSMPLYNTNNTDLCRAYMFISQNECAEFCSLILIFFVVFVSFLFSFSFSLAFSVRINSNGPKCRFPHLCFTRFLYLVFFFLFSFM